MIAFAVGGIGFWTVRTAYERHYHARTIQQPLPRITRIFRPRLLAARALRVACQPPLHTKHGIAHRRTPDSPRGVSAISPLEGEPEMGDEERLLPEDCE